MQNILPNLLPAFLRHALSSHFCALSRAARLHCIDCSKVAQSCSGVLQAIVAGNSTAVNTTEGCYERSECIAVRVTTKQPGGDFRAQDGRLWRCSCGNQCNCMGPAESWGTRTYLLQNR